MINRLLSQESSYGEMESPVGKLRIITTPEGLAGIGWDNVHQTTVDTCKLQGRIHNQHAPMFLEVQQQLGEYFEGRRKIFDLPLVFSGTKFQVQAWKVLLQIPYGQTISYAEQAEQLGHKNKARAVGFSNRVNPIAIVVPCHRVIGQNGQLTGFAGGLDKKAYLLNLERSQCE